jgi:two-component system sensor histidine kinase ChiS
MKLKLKKHDRPSFAMPESTANINLPTIAVIDDEPGNVAALEALLKKEYRVIGFTDPIQALEHLAHERVDVILTDQRMPGLLGTDLLIKLKGNEHYPVSVIVTGYTDVKELVFCINEGLISRYVLKPWEPEDIRAAVRQGIQHTRQSEAIHRLVPEQMLRRVFPNGIEHFAPGHFTQLPCAVMFADLRGFSAIAESLSPSEAYQLLTECFSLITPIIAEHRGFVDKFLGDGVLAIFDSPNTFNEDAIACALQVENKVRTLGENIKGTLIKPGGWRVGIGVSTGMVTLGTIGCPDRVEITVLGDTVNTAARLEETCKQIGASILVQSEMANHNMNQFRQLGLIPLRGKEKLIAIGELFQSDKTGFANSEEMLALHDLQLSGKLPEALSMLQDLCTKYPHDSVLSGILKLWKMRSGQ